VVEESADVARDGDFGLGDTAQRPGAVELVDAGQLKMPAGTILGAGSYALVVAANQDRA
jgi:hypothetical protein